MAIITLQSFEAAADGNVHADMWIRDNDVTIAHKTLVLDGETFKTLDKATAEQLVAEIAKAAQPDVDAAIAFKAQQDVALAKAAAAVAVLDRALGGSVVIDSVTKAIEK